jgi:hypothetical protein
LVNLSGLGFLAVAVPILSLVFCAGLFYFNYDLHRKTGADTPWKGTIAAILLIIVAFTLSLVAR